jgi:hypothetical protein
MIEEQEIMLLEQEQESMDSTDEIATVIDGIIYGRLPQQTVPKIRITS